MERYRSTAIMALFAASGIAQTDVVLPPELELSWGQGGSTVLGSGSTRTQLVYDSPFAAGTTISSIGFRAGTSQIDRLAFTATIEIRVSSGPNAPGSLDNLFANNIGSDQVVVLPQQVVSIPAMPANRSTGFFAEVPFQTPFVFGSNGNTNLVIEVSVFDRSPGASWRTDRIVASTAGFANTVGKYCATSGNAWIDSSSTSVSGHAYAAGETVDVKFHGSTANVPVLLVPSLDQKNFAPGVLLPFDLGPAGGLAGCELLVRPNAGTMVYVTNQQGDATASIPIPAAFASTGLAFQWVNWDWSSPFPVGYSVTPARSVFIGPRVAVPSQQCVWSLASATAIAGVTSSDSCPVVKLTIQ